MLIAYIGYATYGPSALTEIIIERFYAILCQESFSPAVRKATISWHVSFRAIRLKPHLFRTLRWVVPGACGGLDYAGVHGRHKGSLAFGSLGPGGRPPLSLTDPAVPSRLSPTDTAQVGVG